MGELFNPLTCCYKAQISAEELRNLFELLVRNHEALRDLPHDFNVLCDLLVRTLNLRYPRVRLYVADPHSKVYYGFLSAGMNDDFKGEFDCFPEDPYKKKNYQIKFDDVPTDLSEKVTGTEGTYLLCHTRIQKQFPQNDPPKYVTDLGFGSLIRHSLTIHIMASNALTLGAVSIDFGNRDDRFSFEECQIIDAMVGTYWGRIIAPLFIEKYVDKEQLGIARRTVEISVTHREDGKDIQSNEVIPKARNFYDRFKVGIKFERDGKAIIFNASCNPHPFDDVFRKIDDYKGSNTPVFIYGAPGTGKELFAKAFTIGDAPFIAFNCNYLGGDTNLQIGMLFGRPQGTIDSRDMGQVGLFQQASGLSYSNRNMIRQTAQSGLLFLDEVDKMLPDAQHKLLRAIEAKEGVDLGNNRYEITARIIAASNAELESVNFVPAFASRFSRITVKIPALKERAKFDILPFITYYVEKRIRQREGFTNILDSYSITLTKETLEYLLSYDYPFNYRELEGIVEDLLIQSLKSVDPSNNKIQIDARHLDHEKFKGKKAIEDCPDIIQLYPWIGEYQNRDVDLGEGTVIDCSPVELNGEDLFQTVLSKDAKSLQLYLRTLTEKAKSILKERILENPGKLKGLYNKWNEKQHKTGKRRYVTFHGWFSQGASIAFNETKEDNPPKTHPITSHPMISLGTINILKEVYTDDQIVDARKNGFDEAKFNKVFDDVWNKYGQMIDKKKTAIIEAFLAARKD